MNDEHRVSDSDREAAVRLREASTAGRLTLEELSDRAGLASIFGPLLVQHRRS